MRSCSLGTSRPTFVWLVLRLSAACVSNLDLAIAKKVRSSPQYVPVRSFLSSIARLDASKSQMLRFMHVFSIHEVSP